MKAIAAALLLVLAPVVAASHVDGGVQWACGFGGGGREGHPDSCGIDPVGGEGVGSVGAPSYGDAWIDGDEAVLGVVIDGDARAVPVKMLDRHEILNDDIGGVPVAVTYCPLCGSGITFDRRVDMGEGVQTLTFAASGFLYQHDLVMWDAETGTLWTQILGEPVGTLRDGHADTDHVIARLDVHPTIITSWDAWRAEHPDSTMLQGISGFRYGGAYSGYGESCAIGISGQSDCDVDGLHPKEQVLGVDGPRGAVAFPHFGVVGQGGIAYDAATGTLLSVSQASVRAFDAGRHVFHDDNGTWRDEDGRAWDLARGVPEAGGESLLELDVRPMYWFAWSEHHPGTALWLPDDPEVRSEAKDLEDNGKLPGFTIGIVAVFLVGTAWWLRRR